MTWQNVLIEDRASPSRIRAALAQAFGVDEAEIDTVDAAGAVAPREDVVVQCVYHVMRGQFPLRIDIYVDQAPADETGMLQRIANALGQRCLVSDDDTDDPYSMRLIAPGQAPRVVRLDPEALDDRDEHILTKASDAG